MYKILSYGYKAEVCFKQYETFEQALEQFEKMVETYCKENEIDLDDEEVTYDDMSGEFIYGVNEKGIDVYKVVEIPEFTSEVDKLLWEATLELDMVDYAALDYKYSLQECYVEDYTYIVKGIINNVRNMLNGKG